ncbi:F-box protein At2g17036 isoform X2 [Rosa rugosa]|uniref:F-box protein At2g17036 isoform X2 n=1 Tax=Rosa rugosa TaxID=74645 RepID=UPI002B40DB8D|nr:F-box protein At2g17036 isoform X2 [Rosa rugosa]
MASDLSVELLEKVGKCLNLTNDISRFRAVCRSWRSSVPPFTKNKQQLLSPIRGPIQLPKYPDSNGNWPKMLNLTKRVIYHVSHSSSTWVVTVKLKESGEIDRTLDPLFQCPFSREQFPETFPEAFNLLDEDVLVVELAEAYGLRDISEAGCDYRVAMSFNPSCPALMVVVNGLLYHCNLGVDPIPMLKPVEGLAAYPWLEDVIYYEEKFYAVASDAITVVLDSNSLQVVDILVKTRMLGRERHRKYLVESAGDVFLVKKVRHLNYRVFKLNAIEKCWVEMEDDWDWDGRILIIDSDDGCFFPSAQDFPRIGHGNNSSVYFYHPNYTHWAQSCIVR